MEKSTREIYIENLNVKREKIKIKSKIRLISYSKLKSNVIRRYIRRKTQFLTHDSAQIDPINCQIKGFSFHQFEDNCQHSRSNFSLFSQQNVTFKHSLDVEMSLEEKGRDSGIEMCKQFDYSKHP